jgi:serine/threonine-protein kinase
MVVAHQPIAGRYDLEELVGTGGMSSVYRARDRVLERDVALKLLHESLARDDEYLERFRREARSAAQLNHPNIVTVIDRGEDGGRPFIVFEYVEGETLKRLVRERGPLPLAQAARLGLQIARALAFAHARGVVHRDVKPQNVLLDRDGRAHVTDFGIARSLDRAGVTITGTVLGTSDYMSPEQARGERATQASDVYAFGALLYELLTGSVVFPGESYVAVALKHVNEPAPPVLRPGVPPRLAALVERCLRKDPRERFASMDEVAAELEACLEELEAADEADTFERRAPDRAPSRRTSNRLLLVPLFILALGGLAALVTVLAVKHDSGSGSASPTPSPASTPVSLSGVGSYDPYGDNHDEHSMEAPLATDGNPATAWTTETYRTFAKPGVGLVLRAPHAVALSQLTVESDTPGFRALIRAGSSQGGPFADVSPWRTAGRTTTFEVDTHGRRFRDYVIWLLLPNAGAAHVNEVKART